MTQTQLIRKATVAGTTQPMPIVNNGKYWPAFSKSVVTNAVSLIKAGELFNASKTAAINVI